MFFSVDRLDCVNLFHSLIQKLTHVCLNFETYIHTYLCIYSQYVVEVHSEQICGRFCGVSSAFLTEFGKARLGIGLWRFWVRKALIWFSDTAQLTGFSGWLSLQLLNDFTQYIPVYEYSLLLSIVAEKLYN